MRLRLTLALLIGAWCAGSFFMWATAIENFGTVTAILAAPPAELEQLVSPIPAEDLREAMRYQASEVNRLFFSGWGWVQIGIALAAAGLAWTACRGRGMRIAALAVLGITLFLSLYVVPETVRLGREIDFAAEAEAPETTSRFWTLHGSYTGLDMLKVVLLAGMFGGLLRQRD